MSRAPTGFLCGLRPRCFRKRLSLVTGLCTRKVFLSGLLAFCHGSVGLFAESVSKADVGVYWNIPEQPRGSLLRVISEFVGVDLQIEVESEGQMNLEPVGSYRGGVMGERLRLPRAEYSWREAVEKTLADTEWILVEGEESGFVVRIPVPERASNQIEGISALRDGRYRVFLPDVSLVELLSALAADRGATLILPDDYEDVRITVSRNAATWQELLDASLDSDLFTWEFGEEEGMLTVERVPPPREEDFLELGVITLEEAVDYLVAKTTAPEFSWDGQHRILRVSTLAPDLERFRWWIYERNLPKEKIAMNQLGLMDRRQMELDSESQEFSWVGTLSSEEGEEIRSRLRRLFESRSGWEEYEDRGVLIQKGPALDWSSWTGDYALSRELPPVGWLRESLPLSPDPDHWSELLVVPDEVDTLVGVLWHVEGSSQALRSNPQASALWAVIAESGISLSSDRVPLGILVLSRDATKEIEEVETVELPEQEQPAPATATAPSESAPIVMPDLSVDPEEALQRLLSEAAVLSEQEMDDLDQDIPGESEESPVDTTVEPDVTPVDDPMARLRHNLEEAEEAFRRADTLTDAEREAMEVELEILRERVEQLEQDNRRLRSRALPGRRL